ncbi:hypothetical protein AWB76_07281 [Caballeronia temeraria]|uniref:Uncharacterized protein n=1 Tax=Caballeronia temeraria TaxID=1777137 RepID=A0A158DP52_9BURK|nr:hypothetical protein AWB76_07281 [Caballeronia temeraria]
MSMSLRNELGLTLNGALERLIAGVEVTLKTRHI